MKTAIVLGAFDGLHSGHRAVIEQAQGYNSVAVTFDIPPKCVNCGEMIILPQDKQLRLKQLGINQVVMQQFDNIKNILPLDYLNNLKNKYNPDRIICGFNYRFGKDAKGDIQLLNEFCDDKGIEFICVPAVMQSGEVVSSTQIRKLIRTGEMEKATSQIYGGFCFTGEVLHGDKRGRTIGFPTVNQAFPVGLVTPKLGVYISRITVNGKDYSAITNVGLRPTFKTETVGCESYIKDFSEEIYGEKIKTQLLRFVRPEQEFTSIEELKNAILNDVNLLD